MAEPRGFFFFDMKRVHQLIICAFINNYYQGKWQGKVDVAIKPLRDDRTGDGSAAGYEKAKEEFFKEARIFKMMCHPNLVQVKN